MRYIVPAFAFVAVTTLAGCPRRGGGQAVHSGGGPGGPRGGAGFGGFGGSDGRERRDFDELHHRRRRRKRGGRASGVSGGGAPLRRGHARGLDADGRVRRATRGIAPTADTSFRARRPSRSRRTRPSDVRVHHEWNGFSNGVVMLDGTADVTWNFDARERHVVHHAEWTHLATMRTGVGEGDRVQRPLAGGIAEGFMVDGSRSWTGDRGRTLGSRHRRRRDALGRSRSASRRVHAREPRAGKTLSLGFSRVDADTIEVTVTGPRGRSFSFNVNKI